MSLNEKIIAPPYISKSPPPPSPEDTAAENDDIPKDLTFNSIDEVTCSSSASQEKKDVAENNHTNDDDDEWADFVDSNTAQLTETPAVMVENASTTCSFGAAVPNLLGAHTNDANVNITNTRFLDRSNSIADSRTDNGKCDREQAESINLDILSRILEDDSEKKRIVSESTVEIGELDVDSDEMWQQLIEYTSNYDASPSLKFKWYMSELEDRFLESLNVNRVLPSNAQQKPYHKTESNGGIEILQPVKVEQTNSKASSQSPLDNDRTNQTISWSHDDQSKPVDGTNNDPIVAKTSTPVLDIDLTYFENSNPSSKLNSNSSSNQKQSVQKNSRAYIDELLNDIYLNSDKEAPPLAATKK